MNRYLVPLVVFVALLVLLGTGLRLDPRRVPSPLIDRPAPRLDLPSLHTPAATVSGEHFRGKVWLLNVWASWCTGCRGEHPMLMNLARRAEVGIVGLNYKDRPDAARHWLQRLGDPYRIVAMDAEGRAGIDWGVYGVPETFVIDRNGVVRHKHVGPLTEEALQRYILPLVRALKAESS